MDTRDHARFVHDMYEFNDTASAGNAYRTFRAGDVPEAMLMMDLRGLSSRKRDRIVDIHGWCLMNNHYHLLLSERIEGGLTKFIMKLNVGYAKYFNERHKRVGTLFQGRTKKIRIASDPHFLHILHYIHLNPLDFLEGAGSWRTLRIKNASAALKYLESYRWSSYLDYCGVKNFPSVISKDIFADVFKSYRSAISKYLNDIEFSDVQPFLLE